MTEDMVKWEERHPEGENMEIWNKVCQPPHDALKQIGGGRLKGMTDINPQWRYKALTEVFGPCGIGWKFTIDNLWMEGGSDNQVVAYARVSLQIKDGADWSESIPGIGGSMAIAQEKNGLYTSDEAYKMAVTDALSTACKMIGVGADIYAGKWDGSKYKAGSPERPEYITDKQLSEITDMMDATEADEVKFLAYLKAESLEKIPAGKYGMAIASLKKKMEKQQQEGK